ncbi:hypothetical protein GGR57DRAFT_448320 [Xylariaceae sp. FL1272]|nr:hypothetical protein GGR57DRAFT_448320 [Xylariaceae sp. FL1272]
MADRDPADVFAFPDFEETTRWTTLTNGTDSVFKSDTTESTVNRRLTSNGDLCKVPDGFFRVPTDIDPPALETAHERSDDDSDMPSQPIHPIHDVSLSDIDVSDDIWHNIEHTHSLTTPELQTWDAFLRPDIKHVTPLFVTEAGPLAYEAFITAQGNPLGFTCADHIVVHNRHYLAALLALSLGRGSVFFIWDEKKSFFAPAEKEMRISGYSTDVLQDLQNFCLDLGATTRKLSSYVQLAYRKRPNAVSIALARTIDVLLLAVQRKLGEHGRRAASLLQLQSTVVPVGTLLAYFRELVGKLSRMKSEPQILSHIFREMQFLENDDSLLRDLMCEVLARASEPWTDFTEKWIGVKPEEGFPLTKDGPGKSFVKVETMSSVDDFGFESEHRDFVFEGARMPSFVPADIALLMFEAGKNFRLLRTHHPNHPLCDITTVASCKPPRFRWLFDWHSVENLQHEVKAYTTSMLQSISQSRPGNKSHTHIEAPTPEEVVGGFKVFGADVSDFERRLNASIQELDQQPAISTLEDKASTLLMQNLFHQEERSQQAAHNLDPHWSLLPLHSFGPLVCAQARLINKEYTKLLFSAHGLREHMRVQREYQLMGSGMFCSRLSHALFDADAEIAERQAGVALNGGVMGLRMINRETWPPASSELRLVLMGVINETYSPPTSSEAAPVQRDTGVMPGDLSFTIRDLSPEEIDKCMDPHSLEALDFLRLSYKSPAPLSPIMTPAALVKYDRIFKQLLRILRLLRVVGQVSRDISKMERLGQEQANVWFRFRFEAQHFVQSINAYFFDTGIEKPWKQFQNFLDCVQSGLNSVESEPAQSRVVSPDEIGEEHESTLDRIMYVMLLRKRQQPVSVLLDEIFTLILGFCRQIQLQAEGKVDGNASRVLVEGLYKRFKAKVEVFIAVCHNLGEKKGSSSRANKHEIRDGGMRRKDEFEQENVCEALLVNLDMLGYYSRPKF